jgi:hypothetical protein
MRVRTLLAMGAAGLVAFAFAIAMHSAALALVGGVLCCVSFLSLFVMALCLEPRRFHASVQHDHSFSSLAAGRNVHALGWPWRARERRARRSR